MVLEFVHLTIPPPHTPTTFPDLLRTSYAIMNRASGLPSIFFIDLLDSTKMYVLGGWRSKEAHQGTPAGPQAAGAEKATFTGGFNGSPEQGKLIAEINGRMEIGWMEYLDVTIDRGGRLYVASARGGGDGLDVGGEKCVVALVLDCGDLDALGPERGGPQERRLHALDTVLKKLDLPRGMGVYGWNVKKKERESESDYLVVFVGFEGVDEGKDWGEAAREGLENEAEVKRVTLVYMKKAQY